MPPRPPPRALPPPRRGTGAARRPRRAEASGRQARLAALMRVPGAWRPRVWWRGGGLQVRGAGGDVVEGVPAAGGGVYARGAVRRRREGPPPPPPYLPLSPSLSLSRSIPLSPSLTRTHSLNSAWPRGRAKARVGSAEERGARGQRRRRRRRRRDCGGRCTAAFD